MTGSPKGGGGGGQTGGGQGVEIGGEARVALHLRLTRGHRVYAAADRVARAGTTDVRLRNRRRLTRGQYMLTVAVGNAVTVRVPLRVR